jgi:2-keto-3-deoxy-L-rhamnonate aldolase RhmA
MMMRKNATRAKLEAGKTVFGCDMRFPSPEIVEILGALGFDYVRFNLEHDLYNERDVAHSIRAADSFGITPMVRVPNNPDIIRRCLEVGVQGIHVPRINSAEEAEGVVSAVRFRPEGNRTYSATGRAGSYGIGHTEEEVLAFANREVMVILQVEEYAGIQNLDAILAVPHIDAIQIGPKDLWQSMDFKDTEEVWKVIEGALRRISEAGRWSSMVFWINEDPNRGKMSRYGQLGVRMVSVLQGEVVVSGARTFLQQARVATGSPIEDGGR